MSARSQLQSKPVADLRQIADGLGLEHAGLQKAKLIDLLPVSYTHLTLPTIALV